jgi:hypothetical protein
MKIIVFSVPGFFGSLLRKIFRMKEPKITTDNRRTSASACRRKRPAVPQPPAYLRSAVQNARECPVTGCSIS